MKTALVFLSLMCGVTSASAQTVFYLHGKIVEDHGDLAAHPTYGIYEYQAILASLRKDGHTVHSERRLPNTDRKAYAAKIVAQIQTLVDTGATPSDIVVIGFSKGAQIALLVSETLAHPRVRFVFQAVCGSWVDHYKDIRVYGDVLSLYETSDSAGSCAKLFRRSRLAGCEVTLETGLKHGAFYRPIDAWIAPQRQWIRDGGCARSQPSDQ